MKVVKKMLQILFVASFVIFLEVILNPDLREFLFSNFRTMFSFIWALILKIAILPLLKFFFKKGVLSIATIAWGKIIVVGIPLLLKRHAINQLILGFKNKVMIPLFNPVRRLCKHQYRAFKYLPIWKKIAAILPASIIAIFTLIITGVGKVFYFFFSKLSLSKFLTGILTGIAWVFGKFSSFFYELWRLYIRPFFDIVISFIVISLIERIPIFGKWMRKVRVVLKWKWRKLKIRKTAKHLIKTHIDDNVKRVENNLHKKAEKIKTQNKEIKQKIEAELSVQKKDEE